MKIHFIQHVPFEGPANLEKWAGKKGHAVSTTKMFENKKFPSMNEFDWLVVLGGPMGAYDEMYFQWLSAEKKFIKKAIEENKVVVGICLGAQLIAGVLGAKVYKNVFKEIGWHDVFLSKDSEKSNVFKNFPKKFIAFHWHGDTFDLPPESIRIAESKGCKNQAFVYNNRVFGLQFHLESAKDSIESLIENCKNDLVPGKFAQTEKNALISVKKIGEISKKMFLLFDAIEKECGKNQTVF